MMKAMLVGFGAAIVGGLLLLASVHLYADHQNLHALVNMVVSQQQAQALKVEAKPTPAPAPAK